MFGINKNGTKHKIGIIMPAFFPASRTTYDGTTSGLSATRVQGAIDEVKGQMANKKDLSSIIITGSINNTGSTISNNTYFYLSGNLVQASADIANGATITVGTNCASVTAGGLNALNNTLKYILPSRETVTTRVVFGTNNSSGVYASSVIPLLDAENCTITVASIALVGSSTTLNLNSVIPDTKSKYGFTLVIFDSNVSGKICNVTYTYQR